MLILPQNFSVAISFFLGDLAVLALCFEEKFVVGVQRGESNLDP